ncbi:MAG TPA: ParB/RepB/Spo0J family partition protein [Bryobacteraceae bacterium]|nr:ParB/RepB/Spo0J family partition protein [Bryobacteraceae bacterium]
MNKHDNPRKALGRGITTLLPTRATAPATPAIPEAQRDETPVSLAIDAIEPNPLQPRRTFEQQPLAELAQSIRTNGIIQPLVVRKQGDRYQLVAGERRWRAAKLAELDRVPVVVREISDDHLLEITLIENIQREDLNPIETATALMRMCNELNLPPDEIGRRTGKDRSTIMNFMRLLQLPQDIQQMVAERALSAGHARSLLSLGTAELQRSVAARAVANAWSVRETERVIQKMSEGKKLKDAEPQGPSDPNVKAALQELQSLLGTRVRLVEGARKKGKLEIEYYSHEELIRIYEIIVRER